MPDWIGGFQNDEWPQHFADYAKAFAQRYPWLSYYTPVNEIFIAATFSANSAGGTSVARPIRVGMHAVLAAQFGRRRAGIELLEDRDDMRIGEAALAHVSLLAGPYARELTVSACPNLPPQVIESLGPLRALKSGESAMHEEQWTLHADVDIGSSEADLDAALGGCLSA